jgi:DNA polymerase III alpha subunit
LICRQLPLPTRRYKEMFGDRCYIELQNHHLDEDQQKVRTLRNIPIVSTNNVHFQGPCDWLRTTSWLP